MKGNVPRAAEATTTPGGKLPSVARYPRGAFRIAIRVPGLIPSLSTRGRPEYPAMAIGYRLSGIGRLRANDASQWSKGYEVCGDGDDVVLMPRERAPIRSYRDLEVLQRAMDLVVACYAATKTFPAEERYGLTAQIRRSAVSVPVLISTRLQYLGADIAQSLSDRVGEVRRLLSGLLRALRARRRTHPIPDTR